MRVLEQNLDLINLRNQLIEDKKRTLKLRHNLGTQEQARQINRGGVTLTQLYRSSKKSEPTQKNS